MIFSSLLQRKVRQTPPSPIAESAIAYATMALIGYLSWVMLLMLCAWKNPDGGTLAAGFLMGFPFGAVVLHNFRNFSRCFKRDLRRIFTRKRD